MRGVGLLEVRVLAEERADDVALLHDVLHLLGHLALVLRFNILIY